MAAPQPSRPRPRRRDRAAAAAAAATALRLPKKGICPDPRVGLLFQCRVFSAPRRNTRYSRRKHNYMKELMHPAFQKAFENNWRCPPTFNLSKRVIHQLGASLREQPVNFTISPGLHLLHGIVTQSIATRRKYFSELLWANAT